MRHPDSIRMSIVGFSDASRHQASSTVSRLAEAGLVVRLADRGHGENSFESVVASLLDHTIDCIVIPAHQRHCVLPDGCFVAAVLPRRSTRLGLVAAAHRLKPTATDPIGLPLSSTVALASTCQRAQLLALRPDLNVVDPTLSDADLISAINGRSCDAAVLSADDIRLLDLESMAMVSLRPEIMLPAPCSEISLVIAGTDHPLAHHLASLNDPESRWCFEAEQALAEALEWSADLACLATPMIGRAVRLQASMTNGGSDPRSALVRVGVVSSPERVAELCIVALEESM